MLKIRTRGVTLIELVIVLVIFAILSATVMMSLNSSNQHRVNLRADEFRRDVSRAQLLAISQGIRLRLSTTPTGYTGYTVGSCANADCTGTITQITDAVTGEAFSADLTGQNIALTPTSIDFDSLGRPQSAGSLRTTDADVIFSGAGHSVTVRILPITGFAFIAP